MNNVLVVLYSYEHEVNRLGKGTNQVVHSLKELKEGPPCLYLWQLLLTHNPIEEVSFHSKAEDHVYPIVLLDEVSNIEYTRVCHGPKNDDLIADVPNVSLLDFLKNLHGMSLSGNIIKANTYYRELTFAELIH